MDAAFPIEGLISEFTDLLEARDFEGAEMLLVRALDQTSGTLTAFVHLQFGRLYREWNKLTSSVDHLQRATEIVGADQLLRLQIVQELKSVKKAQADQRP